MRSGQQIGFVLTKLDEVKLSAQKDRAERDFDGVVEGAKRLFGHVFGTILSFQVAASPATEALPPGHGLAELLQFWTAPPVSTSREALPPLRPERAMSRLTVVAE